MSDETGNDESFWDSATNLVEYAGEQVVGLAEDEASSLVGVGYHAGMAVGDAATGDWDGAAHESGAMAWDALNVAGEGALDAAAAGWDAVNCATGGELGSAEGDFQGALQSAGNWLGDEAYNLLNPSDATATAAQ